MCVQITRIECVKIYVKDEIVENQNTYLRIWSRKLEIIFQSMKNINGNIAEN